jgi:hypothetical protein
MLFFGGISIKIMTSFFRNKFPSMNIFSALDEKIILQFILKNSHSEIENCFPRISHYFATCLREIQSEHEKVPKKLKDKFPT